MSDFPIADIMASLSVGVLLINEEGCICFANQIAADYFGKKPNTLVGEPFADMLPEKKQHVQLFNPITSEIKHVDIHAHDMQINGKNFKRISLYDITHYVFEIETLKANRIFFEEAKEGMFIVNHKHQIQRVNPAFETLTGYKAQEIIGKNPRILNSGLQSKSFYKNLHETVARDGTWSGEITNRKKNGDLINERLTIKAIKNYHGEVEYLIAVFEDISQLYEQRSKLDYVKLYDQTTGLPNQHSFNKDLDALLSNHTLSRHFTIVIVSICIGDIEEVINSKDKTASKQLFKTVSKILSKRLNKKDALYLVAPNQFTVIKLTPVEELNIEESLASWFGHTLSTICIKDARNALQLFAGVCIHNEQQEPSVTPQKLLSRSAMAMYNAVLSKAQQATFFDAEAEYQAVAQYQLIKEVSSSLEAEEFILYFMPKLNMRSGELIGAEALIRWQHPNQGLLVPSQFLTQIERDPIVLDIDRYVIDKVFKQVNTWNKQSFHTTVSVNISSSYFLSGFFIDDLNQLLAKNESVKPEQIVIEILETQYLDDLEAAKTVVRNCQQIGIICSIDDFGTGYSSLTYLRHLQAKEVKIDQSFIRQMNMQVENIQIIKSVIKLSDVLGFRLIAEGVESLELGKQLLQLGCEYGQGFAISEPMKVEQFPLWADHWQNHQCWTGVSVLNESEQEDVDLFTAYAIQLEELANELMLDNMEPIVNRKDNLHRWIEQHKREQIANKHFQYIQTRYHQIRDAIQELPSLKKQGQHVLLQQKLSKLEVYATQMIKELFKMYAD